MALIDELLRVAKPLGDSIRIAKGPVVAVRDSKVVADNIGKIVRTAALGDPREKALAQWLIRACALEMDVIPASIHDFYLARGQGKTPDDFTVPAINLRALPFNAARTVFRSALATDSCAMIFEIARSEMSYTDQRPAEYTANILAAAIAEGYEGPVFIQGDHFQVSASKYAKDPTSEIEAILELSRDSVTAGFFNIDIDTSTLVDLSKETISEQQEVNYTRCAELAVGIRSQDPEGITISLGGEIGEVGGVNSTEPELRAFMEGFNKELEARLPVAAGLSKISIQTGTSHGGVVLPDGSIAEVSVDFKTLQQLSAIAKEYGIGGAVQHGASTLPAEAFSRFAEANTLEVHLATGFQNILYDELPSDLLEDIFAYLRDNHSNERKEGQTDDQFYYKTRKRAIGPFKQALWDL
ncbi:MAG: class II fructose-bisphosphate aldolase, partial [Anaerolineales bacterium]|nr:class II fructose-bisphosphate aldolase [Anaerolineales bacterium]